MKAGTSQRLLTANEQVWRVWGGGYDDVVVFKTSLSTIRYIVVVSFIGGGNRRIRRKPPPCRK